MGGLDGGIYVNPLLKHIDHTVEEDLSDSWRPPSPRPPLLLVAPLAVIEDPPSPWKPLATCGTGPVISPSRECMCSITSLRGQKFFQNCVAAREWARKIVTHTCLALVPSKSGTWNYGQWTRIGPNALASVGRCNNCSSQLSMGWTPSQLTFLQSIIKGQVVRV